MANLPAPSSKIAHFGDEMVNLPAPSSKTAQIEDEMVNRPAPSSKTAHFEDEMRGWRGVAGGEGPLGIDRWGQRPRGGK